MDIPSYLLGKQKGGGGTPYILPPATTNSLGGIKVGNNLTVENDGTLSPEILNVTFDYNFVSRYFTNLGQNIKVTNADDIAIFEDIETYLTAHEEADINAFVEYGQGYNKIPIETVIDNGSLKELHGNITISTGDCFIMSVYKQGNDFYIKPNIFNVNSGGGSSITPVFVPVETIMEAYINAIYPVCQGIDFPLNTGFPWEEYPHLEIDSTTYQDEYSAIKAIFEDPYNTKNIFFTLDGIELPWSFQRDPLSNSTPYTGNLTIKIQDNLVVIVASPEDEESEDDPIVFTHPFQMYATPIKADHTLYPYYLINVVNESELQSSTGGHNQFSTYTYTIDFGNPFPEPGDPITHNVVLYNNLMLLLNAWQYAYYPSGDFYRGRELKDFLFYLRTPHFSDGIPVYQIRYADLEGKDSNTIYFSSSPINASDANINMITGTIDISQDPPVIEYTEYFFDNTQA